MGTVLERIGAISEAILPGRRKSVRSEVQVGASVISSRGDSAAVTINNVSTHGCNIKGEATWLRIGSCVGVSLDGGPPLQAIVRWLRDGSAGLEFLRPVPAGNAAWHELINSVSNM
jgi:PilZ domain